MPVVVAVVAAGVWLTGGLITDDMDLAMLLTAVWFGLAGLACVLIARARPDFRLPVLGTFVAVAVAIGGYLAWTSLVGNEVNEPVAAAGGGNSELAGGTFESGAHETTGRATAVELAGGGRVLTLTGFETDPGPDLRVYLSTDRDASESEDLGALKGNKGNQQYEIPAGVDLGRLSTVVIWCRAFSVEFGSARLIGS